MEKNKIALNAVVRIEENVYRIIDIRKESVLLIDIEATSLKMQRIALDCFLLMQEKNALKFIEDSAFSEPVEKLSVEDMEIINQKEKLINDLLNEMYPYWEDLQSRKRKEEVERLAAELSLSKKNVFKLIRRYLQSGRNKYALMDGRKSMRNRDKSEQNFKTIRDVFTKEGEHSDVLNDDILKEHYEEGLQYFISGSREGVTLKAAYDRMLREHYSEMKITPQGIEWVVNSKLAYPSYYRFWYHCRKKMGTTMTQVKKSKRDIRNNERLLLGNAQSDARYPGHILEIDEVELDMIQVSADDSRQTVGRAVMYLAVDKFSGCIVGCWVDFENNSYIGITMPQEIYPSCFLPSEIQTDQGSEYISKDMRRIGKELGITINLSPPAMGSLKGVVEQSFHQFQEMMRGTLSGKGIILKQYDSKHYETACLDIHDMRAVAYRYVSWHNQHLREHRGMPKDMIEAGIEPIPCRIWNYGMEHYNKPVAITEVNRDYVRFALYRTDRTFRLSRSGIRFKGLYYYASFPWLDEEMIKLGKKTSTLHGVRYDPRTVNAVYMMHEGKVIEIALNETRGEQSSYLGISWKEYDDLYKKHQDLISGSRHQDLSIRLQTERSIEEIGEASKRMQEKGKNRKQNIRKARAEETVKLKLSDMQQKTDPQKADTYQSGWHTEPENLEQETKSKPVVIAAHYDDNDFSDLDDFFGPE